MTVKKLRYLAYALVAVAFCACQKEPSTSGLHKDYLVYTAYDTEADFGALDTYYLPDSILLIGAADKTEYWKDDNALEIVNTVAAYDLIQWVADSIKRAGKAEGPAVRDAIESAKDLKLLHFTLTLDKATHNPLNKPAAILRQEKGALKFLETYQPQTEF